MRKGESKQMQKHMHMPPPAKLYVLQVMAAATAADDCRHICDQINMLVLARDQLKSTHKDICTCLRYGPP